MGCGRGTTLPQPDHADQRRRDQYFDWPARTLQSALHLKQLLRDLAKYRDDKLEEASCWFEERDVPTTYEAVVGRASEKILAHTGSHPVDLVVIGKRGTRQTERFSMGTTTKRVLRRVRVPTLVVPHGHEAEGEQQEALGRKRIIAATTFTEACTMALQATLQLAEALDAKIDCVHVIKLPVPFTISPAEWPEIVSGETRDELVHRHARDLSQLIGTKHAARCTPYTTIGVSVSESLRDLALEAGAALITIPSHSSGKEHPPRFGGTTEDVVARAPVPVLVFPVRYLQQRFGLPPRSSCRQ